MAKTQSQAFKLDAICAKLKTYRGNEGPLDNNANNTETSSGLMDKDFMDMGKMDPGEEQTPLKNKRKNFHPRNISHFEDQCQNLAMDGNDYESHMNSEKVIIQHVSPSSSEPELKYSLLAQTHQNLTKCLSEGLPKKPPEKEDNIPMDLSFKQARDGHNLYSSGDIMDLSISKLEVPSISLSNYATYKQSSALEMDSASAVLSEYAASLNRNIKINVGNKDEPTGNSADASAMKDYAENTMKELLSIYGLNDMAETITKSVPLSSFSSGKILERHLTEDKPHLEANVVKGCPLQLVPSNSQNVNSVSNAPTPVNPPEVSPGLQCGEGLYESLRNKVVDSMQKLANLPPNHIIGNPRVILPPNMATILTLAALNSKTNSQESSVPSSQPIHRSPPTSTGNCVKNEVVSTLSSHKPLPADYSRYVKRYANSTECGGSHCKDLNYREHFHCLDCNYKVFLKKEEMIRHFKWHKKRDESLQHGFLRFSPMDDCSEKFSQCAHNKKQTHYHCLKEGCDKVYISTSDVQMHANYHRKDSAIIQEGFQRFRATEDCGSTTCFFYGQRTTHFHCRRQGCNFTFKNKADMEKHKSYHIKDEQLNRDGFKKFMKHEHCTFPNCRFSKVCNHIHCIRPGCSYVLHSSGQLYSHKRKHERRDGEIAYRKFKWSQGMKIPSPEGSPSPLLNTSLGILTPKSEPMEPELMSKSGDGADSSESESIPPSSNASITCHSSEMPSTSVSNISETLPKSFAQFATLLTGANLNNSLNLFIPTIPSQQIDYNSSGSEEWKIDEKTQSGESSPPPSLPSQPPMLVMSPRQLQHSPLPLQNSPQHLQHSPQHLQHSPLQLPNSPHQLQSSPHQMQHSPLPLQNSPLQLQHSPLPLQQSAFLLHPQNQEKKPKSDDSWKKYLTRYTANDPCKPRCDLLYKDHYHCISPGCYTTFKSKDGVREHSRCHEQQDQITPLYFLTCETKQPCSYPNCPYSLRETHHHCTWDNCNEIILASDCTFRRLDHFKIHEYSKKMTFHRYSPSMSITTTSDGVFKRKRGRPPKNRVIEVSLATVSNSHQAPQAIFTSFKLPKIGSNVKNSNNFFNMSPSMSNSLSSHLSSTLKLKPMTSNSLANRANIEIQDGFYIFPEFSSCPDVLCPFYSKLHYHCTQPRCFYITDRSDILVLHSKDFHDNIEIWEGFVFFDRSIDCRLLGCHSNKVNRHFHCTRPNCNYSFVRYSTMAIHEQKHKEIAAGMPLMQKIKFPKPKTTSKENGANFNTNEAIPQKQVVKAKGTFYPLSSLPTNKIEVRPEQSDNTSLEENLNNSEDIQGSGNHDEMEPKSIMLPKPPPQAYVHHSEWDTALQQMFTCAEQNCPHVTCQLNHRDHYHCHHCNQAFVSGELLKPHLLHHLNPPDISSSDTESSDEENEEHSPLIRHSTPLYGNNSLSLSLNLNPSFFCNAMPDLKEKCQSPSHIMQINEKSQIQSHDSYLNRKSLSQEFDSCNGEESEDRSFISQDSKDDSYDLSQPDSPNSRRPARKRSQPSKHDDYVDSKRIKIVSPRFMKDEPVPEGYIRFRFNEDCRYSHCGYREHQTHFHCMRSDCGYSFCDKTRFVQHTARHERLDTLMGDEFQQFRTNIMCERSNCTYTGKSSHFHCLKCDFVCTDTNKVVAHRRHHSKLDSIAAAGFSKFMANQDCQNKTCNYSQKQTHYHCLKCQTGVLGLSQMESHKYKHID